MVLANAARTQILNQLMRHKGVRWYGNLLTGGMGAESRTNAIIVEGAKARPAHGVHVRVGRGRIGKVPEQMPVGSPMTQRLADPHGSLARRRHQAPAVG